MTNHKKGSRLASGRAALLIACERGSAGSIGSKKGGGAFRHPERRKTSYVKKMAYLKYEN
ncbi:MAG: hypothetical protein UDM29_07085 [Dialister sp.]|nr:hypothetical protein [Dialister sp.]